jgi:two-component system KDP operon response regulator KdpE
MKSRNLTVLVVDEEPQIRRFLKLALESHDYQIIEAASGQEGLALAASNRPDMIILDQSLPDQDGQTVLKRLREWFQNPIIILSVRDDEDSIVNALDSGANDYLRKPFILNELLARLRLCQRLSQPQPSEPILSFGDVKINLPAHKVTVAEVEIKLTSTEFELLKILALNSGKVLTHRQILSQVWGPKAAENTQYLRVYIGHLRQKLEKDPNQPALITTEPGVGYRFEG